MTSLSWLKGVDKLRLGLWSNEKCGSRRCPDVGGDYSMAPSRDPALGSLDAHQLERMQAAMRLCASLFTHY
ncbi:hypothetical protein VNO77_07771 [Canavalia gladiata]|uniref:Uncharacterized protein n=1 Tax=Canavalia gladiata TaxID=3824 RepID=A0AAN9QWT6_CANGL